MKVFATRIRHRKGLVRPCRRFSTPCSDCTTSGTADALNTRTIANYSAVYTSRADHASQREVELATALARGREGVEQITDLTTKLGEAIDI